MDPFLRACRNYGLVIDANMLIVLIVGMKNKNAISTTSVTDKYDVEDFDNMAPLLKYCKNIIISPYVLPEVSNRLSLDYKVKNGKGEKGPLFLGEAIELLMSEKAVEKHEPFKEVISNGTFAKFGITDTAIIDLATKGYAVLSNDGSLVGFLQNNG